MAEAYDTRGARRREQASFAALSSASTPQRPLTLNDLPNDVLVSIFMATEDPFWVRHTFPRVCKAWNELYLSKDASPLHEALEVHFRKEILWAAGEREAEEEESDDGWEPGPDGPVVHASRVISWAQKRASSVHKLLLKGKFSHDLKDFGAEDLCALVGAVGSSSTEILVDFRHCELYRKSFWKALHDSVVPAGRLRSFVIRGIEHIESDIFESYVEPLGQLAGSLEELELRTVCLDLDPDDVYVDEGEELWLTRFPESFFGLTKLRRLVLTGHLEITAVPAEISSLKKLEDLDLSHCSLSSLPKELGELSGLTKLDLSWNGELELENLGDASPEGEAFPAALGKLKSLRELHLANCGLITVPAFIGKLKSLEILDLSSSRLSSLPKELGELSRLTKLDLSYNESLGNRPENEAFPAELGRLKSLRVLDLPSCGLGAVPAFVGELESLEILDLSYNGSLGNAAFPAALGKLKSLRELHLANCGLSTVPAFIGKLKSLEILDLSDCRLSSLPKELGELSRLTKLDLSCNGSLGNRPENEAFPAELGRLKSLRVLDLHSCDLGAVPAFVGELESQEVLNLSHCRLSSLPKELGELSRLTKLDLSCNGSLGNAAFPEELGKLKSLRELYLANCGLSTVPAFIGKLKSLKVLNLVGNADLQIDAPLDFLVDGCPLLRGVWLYKAPRWAPWTPASLAHIKAFETKLRAKNPNAAVFRLS